MKCAEFFTKQDEQDIISLRRAIHRHPELGRELPVTCALVKRELEALGVPYTEKYCVSSVVGYINYGAKPETAPVVGAPGHVFTVALRADMDALPIQEEVDPEFRSEVPGVMHACGHDAHTAMLLIAARALKRAADAGKLQVRIKLLFQPNEEGEDEGAFEMVRRGCLQDVDLVYGQHVQPELETGKVGIRVGPAQASCHVHNLIFHGKSAHSTMPQDGHDALGMAIKAANDIYMMEARELSPFALHAIGICYLHAGTAHNIIPNIAEMKINVRTYDDAVDEFITERIRKIAVNSAEELGGTAEVTDVLTAYVLKNDEIAAKYGRSAVEAVVGAEAITEPPIRMSSEDFSGFTKVRPGMFLRLGTGNSAKGTTTMAHKGSFTLDEDALMIGASVLAEIGLQEYRVL